MCIRKDCTPLYSVTQHYCLAPPQVCPIQRQLPQCGGVHCIHSITFMVRVYQSTYVWQGCVGMQVTLPQSKNGCIPQWVAHHRGDRTAGLHYTQYRLPVTSPINEASVADSAWILHQTQIIKDWYEDDVAHCTGLWSPLVTLVFVKLWSTPKISSFCCTTVLATLKVGQGQPRLKLAAMREKICSLNIKFIRRKVQKSNKLFELCCQGSSQHYCQ